jgi:putative oxidoreductase
MNQFDLALLAVRLMFGIGLAYHGYNKVFGPGGLDGTARWFGSIGMKWPAVQARLAAATEVGAGLMLAAGLLTPLAAAGVIGVMTVATIVAHLKNGFFVFKPGQGWEYTVSIVVTAWAVATAGPGRASLDHALDIEFDAWSGSIIAAGVGLTGAALQLATCYRPPRAAS